MEADREWVSQYFEVLTDEEEQELPRLSPWLVRVKLDSRQLAFKLMAWTETTPFVASVLRKHLSDLVSVIHTRAFNEAESGVPHDVLHIRMKMSDEEMDEGVTEEAVEWLKTTFVSELLGLNIKGIKGIKRALVTPLKEPHLQPDGSWDMREEFKLVTDGVNLQEVMAQDGIQTHKILCNDMLEVRGEAGISPMGHGGTHVILPISPSSILVHSHRFSVSSCILAGSTRPAPDVLGSCAGVLGARDRSGEGIAAAGAQAGDGVFFGQHSPRGLAGGRNDLRRHPHGHHTPRHQPHRVRGACRTQPPYFTLPAVLCSPSRPLSVSLVFTLPPVSVGLVFTLPPVSPMDPRLLCPSSPSPPQKWLRRSILSGSLNRPTAASVP